MATTPLNASSRIIHEEAMRKGISCIVFDDAETILMEKKNHRWYTRGSRTSLQSSVGKTIADFKPLTKKVLKHFELPTAHFALVKNVEELGKIRELQFPIVMKPVDERHGKGVVVSIQNFEDAASLYQSLQKPMLFEEMLNGTEYRVVCVNFEFVAAAFRKPAHVIGNGEQTIQQLIDEKNKHPWRGKGHSNNLSLILVDETVEKILQEQNYTIDSTPPKGAEVLLRKTANLSTGGEAWDVTEKVCAENSQLFEKIARACDLNVIGIDVMCESLETPIMLQKKAGIIEVNASPGLRMHHYPIQGKSVNVAGKILDMVLKHYAI